jgi:sortase A
MRFPDETLIWLERALFAVGMALATWCLMVFAQARYFERLPVPRVAMSRLPGEGPSQGGRVAGSSGHASVRRGEWVARLDAPSVQLGATVLEGSDDATLSRAAGHIEDTAFPGERGNMGIAGHRDTTFRPVRNLKVGDPLIVTTADRVLEFQVTSTMIVNPDDVYVLDPTDQPTLTLVTCYPFTFIGHAPQRFIVKAALTSERPR